MQKILALPGLAAQDRDVVLEAWQEYRASFPQGSFKTSGEAAETVPGFHRLLLHVRAACHHGKSFGFSRHLRLESNTFMFH